METPSWFTPSLDLAAVKAAVEREPAAVRALRLESRELLDAARRLAESIEGRELHQARAALHLEGARLALRALVDPEQKDLKTLIANASPAVSGLLCKRAADLDAVRAVLGGEAQKLDVQLLEDAHVGLLSELETNTRALDAVLIGRVRWLGLAALLGVAVFVVGAWAMVKLAAPTNLAMGKPWHASSTALTCAPEKHTCGGTHTDIFFHTNNEPNPWLEIDLEAPTTFSRLAIRNRLDMGVARASPLILETSNDRQTWNLVTRRNEPFTYWDPTFPAVTARYVRLRVDKKTWFHLEAVEVFP